MQEKYWMLERHARHWVTDMSAFYEVAIIFIRITVIINIVNHDGNHSVGSKVIPFKLSSFLKMSKFYETSYVTKTTK